MSNILLHKDFDSGITGVSNLFIDTYMKDANDAEIKIYLYLLRMTSSCIPFTISDIADCLNHTERDVVRSLKYWERNRLLELDFDDEDTVVGIHLLTPSQERRRRSSDNASAPILTIVPDYRVASEETVKEQKAGKGDVMQHSVPEKKNYSAAELNEFRKDPETTNIVCIAEQYLNKMLSPNDIKTLMYINKELNFNFEMMDLFLEYCASKNITKPSQLEQVALGWREKGINSPELAKTGMQDEYDRMIYLVQDALGKKSPLTAKEVEFVNKWSITFGFPKDIILAGCERTVLATDTHRFEYADGIFKKWSESGLTTLKEIEESENAFRSKTKSVNATRRDTDNRQPARKVKENSYSSFQKSNYDFDELERDIL
ncbi:MAG: DnaD domain protein [Lachnospiraceae bacterium]|nr:DnaD domain protein [Lachnospiraceae bacterium]